MLLADPEEGLDGGQRHRRVVRHVRAVQRQEDAVVLAAHTAQRQLLAADRDLARDDAELHALAGHRGVHLDGLLQQHLRRVHRLLGQDHGRVLLDDAALLHGDLTGRGAEPIGVVQADRGDHGDGRVDDVGRVPAAAHADLDHGHVHRGVREGRVGHSGEHLEEGQPVLLGSVDHLHVRLDVVVRLDEPLGGDRRPVEADPLGDRLHVRAGVAPGAQLEGVQQGLDHAGRARLAVGAGDVDGRVRALRLAQHVHQRRDPRHRGLQLGLAPAGGELLLHLQQRLGDLGVDGHGGYRVALGRPGLGAQGAATGLDHRQVGVAVGLFRHDLVELVEGAGEVVVVVVVVALGLLVTHRASLRTGTRRTFGPAVSGPPAPGATGSLCKPCGRR